MTKLNTENRELAIEELEIVAGGVIEGGCIRFPDILKIFVSELAAADPDEGHRHDPLIESSVPTEACAIRSRLSLQPSIGCGLATRWR